MAAKLKMNVDSLEETLESLQRHANAGTLTLQMEQDAIDKFEHDPAAIARICDAVFPDDIIFDPNFNNDDVIVFTDM